MRRYAGATAARVLSALLAVLGAVGIVPRVIVTAVAPPPCLAAGTVLGEFGMRLAVVRLSPECPAGSFAPGPSFSQVTLIVSASTMAALVLLGIVALGGGAWLVASLRDLRGQALATIRTVLAGLADTDWIGERPVPVPVRVRAEPLRVPGSHQRRGPPAECR